MFKEGITPNEQSGKPSKANENMVSIREIIQNNRQLTIREVTKMGENYVTMFETKSPECWKIILGCYIMIMATVHYSDFSEKSNSSSSSATLLT